MTTSTSESINIIEQNTETTTPTVMVEQILSNTTTSVLIISTSATEDLFDASGMLFFSIFNTPLNRLLFIFGTNSNNSLLIP